jgi:hypothetical protein
MHRITILLQQVNRNVGGEDIFKLTTVNESLHEIRHDIIIRLE